MMIPVLLAAAVDWGAWSTATFDRARQEARPVFVVVADDDDPVLSDAAAAEVLASRFVAVRIDRRERPDVADLARLALSVVSEAPPPPPEAALWSIFTPSLHPLAAGRLAGVSPEALVRGLDVVADAYRDSAPEMEAKAGIAAARIAASQVPETPEGALTRAVVERAVRAAETGSPGWGSLRLLQAEVEASGSEPAKRALARALEALASAPEPAGLDERALRLRALAEGAAALGSPSITSAVREGASALLRLPNRDGAFLDETEASGRGRVFAYANGLAAGALAAAARVAAGSEARDAAARALGASLAALGPWTALGRCAAPGERCGAAYLEDYAFLAEALLDLQDATGDDRWRVEAAKAADAAVQRFLDPAAGGFFDTDAAHGPLPVRLKDAYDGERPSGNGVMASVLLRLAAATGERRYADLAARAVSAFRGDLEKAPRGLETLAAAAVPLAPPAHVVAPAAAHPSKETRGPVTVELSVSPDHVRAGGALDARVRLVVSSPWSVNGHRPAASDLVPLTVSVPGDAFRVGAVRYPSEASSSGTLEVGVPLRLRPGADGGTTVVRVAVRFQACRGPRCGAPESVVLEAPLTVEESR